MKKNLFLILCLCFCNFSLFAETTGSKGDIPDKTTYDFEKDGCYYNIVSISDLTAELTCKWENDIAYGAYSGDFRVPSTVEYANRTFTVTATNSWAFMNCSFGTLTIPATIKTTGGYGYGTCQNLIVEDSEEPLHVNGVIVAQVYDSVHIGRDFSDIYSGRIASISYDGGEENGGAYKKITFGDKVTEVGGWCSYCQNLTTITLPSSVKKLYRTFEKCENLKSVSGEGVEILDETFTESGIESINMPKLRKIKRAFQKCTSLKSLQIPEGVLTMGYTRYDIDTGSGVFDGATSLASVMLPGTLLSIADRSFAGCSALSTISIANPTPITIKENTFDALTYLTATLKVPAGAKDAYMKALYWKNFGTIEEDASLEKTMALVTVGMYNDKGYLIEDAPLIIDFSQNVTHYIDDQSSYDGIDEFENCYIVPVGCTMTIKPEDGNTFTTLYVNDEEVTTKIVNGGYTLTITDNAHYIIEAEFSSESGPSEEIETVSDKSETTFDFSQMEPDESNQLSVSLGSNDYYNETEGRLEIASVATEEEVSEALQYATPGSSNFKDLLPSSITIELPQGEGDIEIDCQVLPGFKLQVKVGSEGSVSISAGERGKANVHYNVSQKTYVVIYLASASSASAPARLSKASTPAGAYIYAVKVKPKNAGTGIEESYVESNDLHKLLRDGHLLILHDGKTYNVIGVEVR